MYHKNHTFHAFILQKNNLLGLPLESTYAMCRQSPMTLPILSRLFKSPQLTSIYFSFILLDGTITLIDIRPYDINMEFGVIKSYTKRRWSTGQSITKHGIVQQVDPLNSILWRQHSSRTRRYIRDPQFHITCKPLSHESYCEPTFKIGNEHLSYYSIGAKLKSFCE